MRLIIARGLLPVACCLSPVVWGCGPRGAGSSSQVGESTYSESGSGSGSGSGAESIDEDEALRRALVARHRGDLKTARVWAGRAGERGAALLAEIERGERVDSSLVAVLLPLSGRHAGIGREMRIAIELAGGGRAGGRLVFHDTRGEEAEAERLVERAFADGAVGVLGPVGQAESRAAATRAAELGLPIAVLAPGVAAAPSAGLFRLWPSPEWEAAEAARLAVALGHDRLAVLAPRDDQGAAQTAAFRRAATAAGAEVVAVGDYDPTGSELEPDLKRFLGLDPMHNERLRRHLRAKGTKQGWKSFSPDIAFDLLYVPDEHTRAALVASYLPYFNIEVRNSDVMDTLALRKKHGGRLPSVVQLLGSSAWHHGGLIPRGGPAVDGALVVIACGGVGTAGDEQQLDVGDDAADFIERFEQRTGRPPGPVAAQAHDAARLFLAARSAAAARRGAAPRTALSTALATAELRDGACGPSRVIAGALTVAAGLLQVDGDEFTPVDQ
jgi:ABC-type branched-subunit amino acid transport system substrate-binding protein